MRGHSYKNIYAVRGLSHMTSERAGGGPMRLTTFLFGTAGWMHKFLILQDKEGIRRG